MLHQYQLLCTAPSIIIIDDVELTYVECLTDSARLGSKIKSIGGKSFDSKMNLHPFLITASMSPLIDSQHYDCNAERCHYTQNHISTILSKNSLFQVHSYGTDTTGFNFTLDMSHAYQVNLYLRKALLNV